MIPVLPGLELAVPAFYFRASTLAHHTQDFLRDPRAGLLLAEHDGEDCDTQTLARISLQGQVVSPGVGPISDSVFLEAQRLYFERFPESRNTLALGDFDTYAFQPLGGRYIAGPGQAYDLSAEHLLELLGPE
jgi:hypothetical protein